LLWGLGLVACSGDDLGGLPEPRVTTNIVPATSAECPGGGQKILTGVDADGDGALEGSEIDSEVLSCQGDGANQLVQIDDEPPGPNCASGGTRIRAGPDADGDGVLQPDEVSAESFVCSGGQSLIRFRDLPPGEDCPSGGTRIEIGSDQDGDGVLDPEEVTDSRLQCEDAPITIVTESLPLALRGRPYRAELEGVILASGGAEWSTLGELPAGLELVEIQDPETPRAVIEGAPSDVGSSVIRLQLEDRLGRTVERSLELEVQQAFEVRTSRIDRMSIGLPVNRQLEAVGATNPTWELASDSMPPGLSLSSGGTIVGTPTQAINETIVVRATRADGLTVDAPIGLTTRVRQFMVAFRTNADGFVIRAVTLRGGGAPLITTFPNYTPGNFRAPVVAVAPSGGRYAIAEGLVSSSRLDRLLLYEEAEAGVVFAGLFTAADLDDVVEIQFDRRGDRVYLLRRDVTDPNLQIDALDFDDPSTRRRLFADADAQTFSLSPTGDHVFVSGSNELRWADASGGSAPSTLPPARFIGASPVDEVFWAAVETPSGYEVQEVPLDGGPRRTRLASDADFWPSGLLAPTGRQLVVREGLDLTVLETTRPSAEPMPVPRPPTIGLPLEWNANASILAAQTGVLSTSGQAPLGAISLFEVISWIGPSRLLVRESDSLMVVDFYDFAGMRLRIQAERGQAEREQALPLSPDGRWVVVERESEGGEDEYFLVNTLDPRTELRIGVDVDFAHFLPDSSALVFYGARMAGTARGISIIDTSSVQPRDLGELDFGFPNTDIGSSNRSIILVP